MSTRATLSPTRRTALVLTGVLSLACALGQPEVRRETRILAVPDGAKGDIYGGALGVSGDFAFCAAEWDDDDGKDSGAVWVFRRAGGEWERTQKLRAPDAAEGDNFGRSVAVDGRTAVIGAHWDDTKGGENTGSAYVFRFDGRRWVPEQKLLAPDGRTWDALGNACAIEGEWIAVSAWRHDVAGNDSGAVYLWRRGGEGWEFAQKLVPKDPKKETQFGRGVWISGDALVVGAWLDDTRGEDAGAAYVFRLEDGRWTEEQKLVAKDGKAGDRLGFSVSIDGDEVLVGAHKRNAGRPDSGAAYLFRYDGERWEQAQLLAPANPQQGAWVGWAVALDGEVAVLSSHFAFDKEAPRPGVAHVFERKDERFEETLKLVPSDGHPGDTFAFHLALDGRTLVTGSWRHKNAGVNSGQSYVFEL